MSTEPPAAASPATGDPGWRARLRVCRQLWRLRRSGLIDAAWYHDRHPNSAGRELGHYLRHGADGRDPGPGFSATAYLAANRDVAAAGINPLLHYLLAGWAEGRPLRYGPHDPLILPKSAVLSWPERIRQALRTVWPRRRVLAARPGPDPAATIRIAPDHGAMPTGWALLSAHGGYGDQPAHLLVTHGGRTMQVDVPARPVLVRLPDTPGQFALQRADRPGPKAQPRPRILVHEFPARGGKEAAHPLVDAWSYAAWIRRFDAPEPAPLASMAARLAAHPDAATFRVVSAGTSAARALAATLGAQPYPHWHLDGPGRFVVFVGPDTTLAPHALVRLAAAIRADPEAELLYGDEDQLLGQDRRTPWFKPDFSPELGRRLDLFGRLGVIRAELLQGREPPDWPSLAAGRRVAHVPHILSHAHRPPPPTVAAEPDPDAWPSVTAIVPTRDHADLLATCLGGLLDGTDYPLDILVADNGSTETTAVRLLEDLAARGVRVVDCAGPFNYAAINNRAAAAAHGELLLFLNNDIEILRPDWLKAMVRLAVRPGIGAVGAKLLYPDGTLQHGGIVLGMGGVAGHIHQGVAGDAPGYFGRLAVTQEVAAVTAACMLVPARHFAAIGGFDATHLPVAFNDVDLCLRLRAAGLRILWTPDAVLTHAESKSRGSDLSASRLAGFSAEIATMQTRWADALWADPFHSLNLSLETTDIALAFPPRIQPPWLSGPGT